MHIEILKTLKESKGHIENTCILYHILKKKSILLWFDFYQCKCHISGDLLMLSIHNQSVTISFPSLVPCDETQISSLVLLPRYIYADHSQYVFVNYSMKSSPLVWYKQLARWKFPTSILIPETVGNHWNHSSGHDADCDTPTEQYWGNTLTFQTL